MDIEEELAELRAELDRSNEDPKVMKFVKSREYRNLLKEQKGQICESCGKEFRITHLCESVWKFEWSDLWKHYAKYEVSSKNTPKPPVQINSTATPKTFEYINKPPAYPKPNKPNQNSNSCGVCICIIIVVVFLVIFL